MKARLVSAVLPLLATQLLLFYLVNVTTQKQPSCKKRVRPQKPGKSCEIKGGGQEIAAMMLMLIMHF